MKSGNSFTGRLDTWISEVASGVVTSLDDELSAFDVSSAFSFDDALDVAGLTSDDDTSGLFPHAATDIAIAAAKITVKILFIFSLLVFMIHFRILLSNTTILSHYSKKWNSNMIVFLSDRLYKFLDKPAAYCRIEIEYHTDFITKKELGLHG